MFSYSVAVQDAWAFHWHNISGRLTVYLFSLAPAEALCRADRDARRRHRRLWAAVLRDAAARAARDVCGRPLQGPHHLRLRLSLDRLFLPAGVRLPDRNVDGACLVLAGTRRRHYARRGIGGIALVFAVLLALIFTHEGALVLAAAILATLAAAGHARRRVPASGRRLLVVDVDLGGGEGDIPAR